MQKKTVKKTAKATKTAKKTVVKTANVVEVKTPVEVSVEAPAQPTVAEKIWSEIKDLNIEMFALPDQKVHQYCSPIPVDPSRLFLLSSATSVLPSLEMAVRPKYTVERIDKFLVVTPTTSK